MDKRRAVLTCALALVVLPAPPAAFPAPAAAAPTAPTAPTASARADGPELARARATGQRVEVLGARTEVSQTFARPDGSFVMDETLQPRFARQADGSWRTADATLRRNPDGSVSPVASTLDMRFSGGGSAPFATLRVGSMSLSLTWPGTLPAPVVTGNIARYRDVLPGVDLEAHAGLDSFTHLLVIRSAKAAANPALRQIVLRTRLDGLSLRGSPATGAVSAVDTAGREVFGGPSPSMWDSREGPPAADPSAPPREPRRGPVAVELAPGELRLVPDAAMLADPSVTWPLVIDPTWTKTSGKRNAWAQLRKSEPTRSFYNATTVSPNDSTRGVVHVGFNDWEGPSYTDRSLFDMDVSRVKYTHIYKATFSLTQTWAGAGCSYGAKPKVNLRVLNQAFGSSTVWNTAWNTSGSGWGATLASSDAIRRYGDSCAPRRVEFNVTGRVTQLAAAGGSHMYLGLRAASESDKFAWKRYKLDPGLSIEFNTRPNAPAGPTVTGKACASGTARPYVTTATPAFAATAKDPDTGQQSLTTRYYWWKQGQALNPADYVQGTSANPGTATSAAIPAAKQLVDGQTYVWQAQTLDDVNDSQSSGTCEFTADLVDPAAAASVTSTDYPAYTGTTDMGHGGVGIAGTFRINASPSTDVVAFAYTFDLAVVRDAAPRVGLAADRTGSVPHTPLAAGLLTMRVWAVDRADRYSTARDYQFKVKTGGGPAARWSFDDPADLGIDSSGQTNVLAPAGGAAATTGRAGAGFALSLNGTTAYAATAGPLSYPHPDTGAPVTVRTDTSLTLSAWVRLTSTSTTDKPVVVSINGSRTSATSLDFSGPDNRWRFVMTNSDVDSPGVAWVFSDAAPTAGRWTHLAGTYDAGTRTMRFYVNGVLQAGTRTISATFNATGPVQVGRRKWAGNFVNYLNGAVDDVRVYSFIPPVSEFVDQSKPLAPTVSFPGVTQVPVGGSVQVRFATNGDTNATSFKYSVGTPGLGQTVTATANGDATVSVPAAAIGELRVYAAVVYGGSGNLLGPVASAAIQVTGLPSISGVVYDKQTGQPVAGATVTVEPAGLSVTSAANGTYSVGGFPSGAYTVAASAGGRCGKTYRTDLDITQTVVLDLWLGPAVDRFGYACQPLPGQPFQPADATVLALTGNDAVTQVALPFGFPFYGAARTTAWVDTNGIVTFEDPGGSHPAVTNLPAPAEPNAMVAAFWDDLVVDASASVRTATLGSAPFRQFVVEWRNVYRAGNTGQRITVEVVLDETGLILLNYASLDGTAEQGDQAAVGIESPGGEIGLEYSYQSAALASGTAIAFLPPLDANPIQTFALSGTVTDAQTGAPIAGVTVTLEPAGVTDTTAANGGYDFAGLEAGNYTVFAAQGARCAKVADLTVDVFAATDADLALRPVTDEYGYSCVEGAQAFIPAAGDGGPHGDEQTWQATPPFPIKLYGSTYTTAWLNSNGLVTFRQPEGDLWNASEIPSLAANGRPNAAVYPFWEDWVVDDQSEVLQSSLGTAPNRRWIVEWRDVVDFDDPTARVSFEVIFDENGDITFAYANIDPANATERGAGATVGIEDTTGTVAFQYLYQETRLASGQGVRFHALPPGPGAVTGTVTCQGSPLGGAVVAIGARTASTAADGTYTIAGVTAGPYSVIATAGGSGAGGVCKGSSVVPVMVGTGTTQVVGVDLTAAGAAAAYSLAEQAIPFVPASTVLGLAGDDEYAPLTLPFPVVLYGQSYGTGWVDTNGVVSFVPPDRSAFDYSAIPSPAATNRPNAAVYPFWHDWVVDAQASVRTAVTGTAPNRQFIVEWRNVYSWEEPSTRVSFEVVFHESGGFTFAYADQEGSFVELGGAATIGIENADGTTALQYTYRHPALRPGTAIRIYPPTP